MGRPDITAVIRKLQQEGYRAARAFPGVKMPHIQKPAVAVALHEERSESQTLAVSVLYPETMGGGACEDDACRVADILREQGYVCIQEHCQYDGKSDRFSVRILAVWEEPKPEDAPFSVSVEGTLMKYVEAFSSEQKSSVIPIRVMGQTEPVGYVSMPQPWTFTMEELIPVDMEEPAELVEPFSFLVRRGGIGEYYQGCRWTSQIRRDTEQGLVKVRTGTAESRSILNYD